MREDDLDPHLARFMLKWMREAGHEVTLEQRGDGQWVAAGRLGDERFVAVRDNALNALSVIAMELEFDLQT
jgi:hypothetical protein